MARNITTEYAGPASRQVGTLPWYDVRAWWTADGAEGGYGPVKLAAGRELKKHVPDGSHVECVGVDADTYNTPNINAMITFRVLTDEQFKVRAELRARHYAECETDGCEGDPGQVVQRDSDGTELALCFGCWHPNRDAFKVLHWINRGRVSV
jgi:hypothetical protein